MGFSTSGAVAVMLIGLMLAAGTLFPTLFAVGSATGDAFSSQSDQIRDQKNTDLEIRSAELENDTLTTNVTNEGTVTLELSSTDVLVDGQFVHPNETTVIDGDRETNETRLWPPGTELEIVIEDVDERFGGDVDRVKVVTETAIADAAAVETIETEEEEA